MARRKRILRKARTGSISRAIAKSRERKATTQLSFAFADKVSFLNSEHWDQVAAANGVLLSREYLSTLDDGGVVDATMRYGLIYDGKTPIACLVTQTVDVTGDQLIQSIDQLEKSDQTNLGLKRLTRKALEKIHRRVTVCGNLVSWGQDGFGIGPGVDAQLAWQGLTEALYRLRRGDKLYGQTDYVLVKDLSSSVKDISDSFATQGYRALDTEPNMVLAIAPEWNSFDDYLAGLTKKYRKAARTVIKDVEAAGCRVEAIDDVEHRAAEIHRLYKNVAARADVRLAELSKSYLPNLSNRLGPDRFAVLGIKSKSEQLLGFVTVVKDGDTAVGYYLGIDYPTISGAKSPDTADENSDLYKNLPVYHRLLFAVIEQALEWKSQRISFGRTALEAKARLGCQPEETFVWVRHRVPLLNLLVKQLLKAVPHDEPPERNPFK